MNYSGLSSNILELIILPTEKCNFRCTYCYEDFEIGKISDELISGIENLIAERASDVDLIKIEWFGGEPLLNKSAIKRISKFVQDKSREEGFLFHSGMTTNGFLLDTDLLTDLVNLGVTNYQVSIDGPERLHDASRIQMNGAGSFRTIHKNLMDARDSDLQFLFTLRIHFTPDTYQDVAEWVGSYSDNFGNDDRFIFHFKSVGKWGGENDDKISLFEASDLESATEHLYKAIGKTEAVGKNTGTAAPVCYASRPNSFVIRADGRIAKCTVAFRDQLNHVGQLSQDGSMSLDVGKMRKWIRGYSDSDPKVLACPYGGIHNA